MKKSVLICVAIMLLPAPHKKQLNCANVCDNIDVKKLSVGPVSNIKSLTSISSSEISRNDDFCSYKFEGGEMKESLSFQHLRRKLNNFITKSFPVKMAWLTNNSSGNGFGQSSNSHGGFSNNWCMQADSNRGFKSGSYQQHSFSQRGTSSSNTGNIGLSFSQPKRQKTEEEKKKNKYEAVKKFRLQKETEAFLEEEEIKDLKKKLREQEREKSELIGEARMLSKLFTNIAINNPNYTDKEFHRCRTALYNASNATHRT